MTLTENERTALSNFVAHEGALWSALNKFAQARKQAMDTSCADAMRTVPRQAEQAADYAAKAEAFGTLLAELSRFSREN